MSAISHDQFQRDFQLLQPLGSGNCAQVHKIRHRKTHAIYALKISRSDKLQQLSQVICELEVIAKLNDDAVPKIFHYYLHDRMSSKNPTQQPLEIGVIMELYDRTLEREIQLIAKAQRKPYCQQELWDFMSEMIRVFSKLQRLNINHRDIKSGNIMIHQDGPSLKYKLIDFGYALKNTPYAAQSITGTQDYASPKIRAKFEKPHILVPGGLNVKDDVYSLGNFSLNAGKTILELLRAKQVPNEKLKPEFFTGKLRAYDANIAFILSKMLAYNEDDRWDFIQVEKEILKISKLKSSNSITIDEDSTSDEIKPTFEWQNSQPSSLISQNIQESSAKNKTLSTIETQTETFNTEQISAFKKKLPQFSGDDEETKYILNEKIVNTVFSPEKPVNIEKSIQEDKQKILSQKTQTTNALTEKEFKKPSKAAQIAASFFTAMKRTQKKDGESGGEVKVDGATSYWGAMGKKGVFGDAKEELRKAIREKQE